MRLHSRLFTLGYFSSEKLRLCFLWALSTRSLFAFLTVSHGKLGGGPLPLIPATQPLFLSLRCLPKAEPESCNLALTVARSSWPLPLGHLVTLRFEAAKGRPWTWPREGVPWVTQQGQGNSLGG